MTSISSLILKLRENQEELSIGTNENPFTALLMDIIMASYLIKTSAPLKVLELGATSGILSYHLAILMGKLNPESSLCCVSDVIGNGSKNHWLNRVSRVEQPPKLSLVISDYGETLLESGFFDIVIINGTEHFENPNALIQDAERLLKKGGNLLCHAANAPFLENCFKEAFPDFQEYEGVPDDKVLIVVYRGAYKAKKTEPNIREEIKVIINRIKETLTSRGSQEQLRAFIPEIDQWIDESIKRYDIDSKKDLICLKQLIIDYMLNIEDELEDYYKGKLERFQNKLLQDI